VDHFVYHSPHPTYPFNLVTPLLLLLSKEGWYGGMLGVLSML